MPRPKGSPNKDTKDLMNLSDKLGIDPFHVLLLFVANNWKALGYSAELYVASEGDKGTTYKYNIDPAVRAKAAAEACQYLYPKRRAIELSNAEDTGFKVVIEDYTGKAK